MVPSSYYGFKYDYDSNYDYDYDKWVWCPFDENVVPTYDGSVVFDNYEDARSYHDEHGGWLEHEYFDFYDPDIDEYNDEEY